MSTWPKKRSRLSSVFVCTLLASGIVLAAGCASTGKKEPTPKEQARTQWNNARASVLFGLAKSQFDDGNLNACRKTMNEALALDPQSVPLRLLSARLSIEQGRLELAEKELALCREIAPKNAEAHYFSGVIYQRWQRPQTALEFYAKASELAPAELAFLLARAEMLLSLDHRDEAIALLQEKLTYFENSPAIREAVGQMLVQDGKYELAVPLLRQASILAPEEAAIREHLGLALYWAKEYREAATVLERLLRSAENESSSADNQHPASNSQPPAPNAQYASRADLWIVLGECQMLTDRPREARDSYQAAAQIQPAAVDAWLCLAKVGLKIGDLQRVELSVRKAISLSPANSEAYLMLGYLRLRQDKQDEALAAFQKAGELDEKDATPLSMCGYVLEKKGRLLEAMECYGRALKLDPDDELASMLMAQIQAKD